MTDQGSSNPRESIINFSQTKTATSRKATARSSINRRKGRGLLSFFIAGGVEQRWLDDRRTNGNNPITFDSMTEKRSGVSRRRVINTKYLNCGKCIDNRKNNRRTNDRIDQNAVEREKFRRLGPGWL